MQTESPSTFEFAGCRFGPPGGDEVFEGIAAGRDFERHELAFVSRFLRPGMIFWDVGAHLGLYTVLGAKAVGAQGSVLAVEPDPTNYHRLQANLDLNALGNVESVKRAVCDRAGMTSFQSCRQGAYSGIKVAKVPASVETINVETTTIDTLAGQRGWPSVDFMKLDVEGAELSALRGGVEFFEKKARPVLMCEFSDRRSVAFGHRCSEIYEWLTARDFIWHAVRDAGVLARAAPQLEYDYENLVACPREKLQRLAS